MMDRDIYSIVRVLVIEVAYIVFIALDLYVQRL